MSIVDYGGALKQGRKCYHDAVTKGRYPYLPALDPVLSYSEVAYEENLGIVDIPLSRIVGTKTEGRTNAFAGNFMPLLPADSEFASKWALLYDYQVTEGIKDPIVVYEFMNQFYVLEGNKRVSVMKYLNAYSIHGDVTRLIPKKREDSKENRLYYEFLDFYRVALNCDVWFSREGSYRKLLKLMGKGPDEEWSDDEHVVFNSSYSRFVQAFQKFEKDRFIRMNCSDVFLIYVEIFGYQVVSSQTEREMLASLHKIEKEISLADSGSPVELVESPEEVEETARKPLLLNWFKSVEPEQLKPGFIHTKTAQTSSWTYAHELGRMHLEEVYGGRLKTVSLDQANNPAQVEEAIEKAVASGCNMIFTTAPQMVNESVRAAVRHPEVKVYNCSIKMSYSSICTYYARMYEAKFLMGAIGAALSRTGKLGYIADYPIYGTMANINAFALGARMIDPEVKVYLEWSRTRDSQPVRRLEEEGIRFISGDDIITPQFASRAYGLYARRDDGTLDNIATPILHWGKFYERIVRLTCRGNDEMQALKGRKAVNYWWGMSADVIEVICSKNIPHGTHRLIEFLRKSIRSGSFHPFDGLIYSQNGIIRCGEGESLSSEQIITMDWLAENVIGRIPDFEELNEEAQGLVVLQRESSAEAQKA